MASCVTLIFKVEGVTSASLVVILMALVVTFVEAYFFALSAYMFRAAEVMSQKAVEEAEDVLKLHEVLSGAHEGVN